MTAHDEHRCDCAHEAHGDSRVAAVAVAEVASLLMLAVFLIFSGTSGRLRYFLTPGFWWLPPAAGVLLAAMGAGRLLAFRAGGRGCECDASHSGATPMRWLYAVVIVVPMVFALAVNPHRFSAEGVRKRTAPVAPRDAAVERAMNWVLGLQQLPGSERVASGELPAEPTVPELARALEGDAGRGLAGRFVTVIGQCGSDDVTPGGRFDLYRLVVTCCVADATAVSVEVAGLPTVTVESGQWLRIGGVVRFDGGVGSQAVLHAASILKISAPSDPYL
jgi:uncharacterized repeat protein (TIGR03943 family)